ncbi:MAG: NAD(P)H-binding protein [Erythrobacter sp.]
MSELTRLALVGATGLIGRRVIETCNDVDDIRVVGVSRREAPLPDGARMEMFVAEPDKWGEVFASIKPRALICALGTTWKKSGRDEAAFRAVDYDLILATAEAAVDAGIPNMVIVSSVGADPTVKNFYLRVKGETEQALSKVGFKRLDILRPGLLRGSRINDWRIGERLAMVASPVLDPLLGGKWSIYRSIEARIVAEAALGLAMRNAAGRFIHDGDAMKRAARDWRDRIERLQPGEDE